MYKMGEGRRSGRGQAEAATRSRNCCLDVTSRAEPWEYSKAGQWIGPALCGDTCLDARALERPSKEGFPRWPTDIYVE
jgi:hypothetical protein